MKIVICPDSFKESLSAPEVARAIARGVTSVVADCAIDIIPLADGGEGTVEAFVVATGGLTIPTTVTGPLGEPVQAYYGVLGNTDSAVIEMAVAAGLHLVPVNLRDPKITTSYGVGELIKAAYDRGCKRFTIGIGGSATNDGGAGAMQALGVKFLDATGHELPLGGAALAQLDQIDISGLKICPGDIEVRVACDVTNPLTGLNGATAVYGPQKGATPEDIIMLDRALSNYAMVIRRQFEIDVDKIPGAGAAGGLGAGLAAFLGAKLEPGIDIVLDAVKFDERVEGADLVITGEGRVDRQTAFGKTIAGVLKRIKHHKIPVLILAGSVEGDIDTLYDLGATSIMSIVQGPCTLEDSMRRASELLERTAANAVRLLMAGRKH